MSVYCTSNKGRLGLVTEPPANPDAIFWTLPEPPGADLETLLREIDLDQPVGAIKRELRDRFRPLWEAHRRGRKDAPETIFESFKEAADQVAEAWLAGQEKGLVIHTMRAIDYFHVDQDTLILLPPKRVKSGIKPADSRFRWKPGAQLQDRILIASLEGLQAIALNRPLSPYCVLAEAAPAAQEDQLVALFKRCPVVFCPERKTGR